MNGDAGGGPGTCLPPGLPRDPRQRHDPHRGQLTTDCKGCHGEATWTPSTVSTVGNKSWYYISQTSRRPVRFMGESVTDQRVLAVYFDGKLVKTAPVTLGDAE